MIQIACFSLIRRHAMRLCLAHLDPVKRCPADIGAFGLDSRQEQDGRERLGRACTRLGREVAQRIEEQECQGDVDPDQVAPDEGEIDSFEAAEGEGVSFGRFPASSGAVGLTAQIARRLRSARWRATARYRARGKQAGRWRPRTADVGRQSRISTRYCRFPTYDSDVCVHFAQSS